MIHSYPTVYQIGHRAISNLFDGIVTVEEKVDGSQFSFGVIDGELQCRSHGKQLIVDNPEKMFKRIVDIVVDIRDNLHPGWTYRGEYLEKPKHNALQYSRIPKNHLIGFDIMADGQEDYFEYGVKVAEFERLGFETVPLLYSGKIDSPGMLTDFLDRESVLGGTKIEGVVVKNYTQFSLDKKTCMGKYVSERFKEVANKDWKNNNPTLSDIIQRIGESYKTDARWNKAVQHLRENGELDESPKDIGKLIAEINHDLQNECADEIKDALYRFAISKITRISTHGFPEWYKNQLLQSAFKKDTPE